MAVTIITNPDSYCFTRNPIIYKVATNIQYINTGSYANVLIAFSAAPATGSFRLVCSFFDLTFTLISGIPNNSGLQITNNSDMQQQSLNVKEVLKAHPVLNKYFQIKTETSNSVTLTAREKGSAYTVTITTAFSSSSLAGTDIVERDNFKIRMQLFMITEDNADPKDELIQEQELSPDAEGVCYFDVSTIVNDYVDYDEPPTTVTFLEVRVLRKTYKKFYAVFSEQYGSPVLSYKGVIAGTFIGVYGGKEKRAVVIKTLKNILDIYPRVFLNTCPNNKIIPGVKANIVDLFNPSFLPAFEYLTIITDSIKGDTVIMVDIFFTNGETETHPVISPFTINQYDDLILIPAGMAQLGLYAFENSLTNKIVSSYEVYLADNDEYKFPKTEKRKFILDYKYQKNRKTLLFGNSYGGYETLSVFGSDLLKSDYTSETINKSLPVNSDASKGEIARTRPSYVDTVKVFTGFMPNRKFKLWLKDLFNSEKTYESIGFSTNIQISIEKKSFEAENTLDVDFTEEIEYKYSFKETSSTGI